MTKRPLPLVAHSERLIVLVGPSGAGKDSVLAAWRARRPAQVHFAQRLITRPVLATGEQHQCIDETALDAALAVGDIALHWRAHGLRYAIPFKALTPLARGEWVVVNGSREHLPHLRTQAPRARIVSITASPALLARRLQRRGREAASHIEQRLARNGALGQPAGVDISIVNDGTPTQAAEHLAAWFATLSPG